MMTRFASHKYKQVVSHSGSVPVVFQCKNGRAGLRDIRRRKARGLTGPSRSGRVMLSSGQTNYRRKDPTGGVDARGACTFAPAPCNIYGISAVV